MDSEVLKRGRYSIDNYFDAFPIKIRFFIRIFIILTEHSEDKINGSIFTDTTKVSDLLNDACMNFF